jgi:hypothetical protein
MLEDLKALIDGAQGEALDVPHPNQQKNTEMTALTRWHRSEATSDFEMNMLGGPELVKTEGSPDWGKPLTYVRGQINRVTVMDEYSEPVGEPAHVVLHRLDNPKAKTKDISSSKIGAFNCRELRRRFPEAFAEFERKMNAEGTPLPIALLDEVPPHVIQILMAKGTSTIEQFAAYATKDMKALETTLSSHKMNARIPYLPKYRDQAREKIGYTEQRASAKEAA